ncbi:MAG: DEAD/DEAH box helicase family protein, partial [Verrucomicrobiota bacterium]|nr:DEAD/DEAH box helicase family protein [Verrucomicrobiota bacterium]
MQIDPLERSVKLSARELAVFRNQPLARSISHSQWRANVGQQWHKRAEYESKNTQSNARFEVSVHANWQHRGWMFNLSGRIDQLLSRENGILIREIKTIRSPLPVADETLIEQYGNYFAQVAIYQALLKILPEYANHSIKSEVQFINIENGARQSVLLESSEEKFFEAQLDQLIPFLNERLASVERIRRIKVQPAFSNLRPGQTQFFNTLSEASVQSRIVLAQAPTGFGKTGIILEHALKQMQNGIYDRCVYLSSKSTGQLETVHQLKQMIGCDLRFMQMRNREEHRITSERHICTGDELCDSQIEQNWHEAKIHPEKLFIGGTLS